MPKSNSIRKKVLLHKKAHKAQIRAVKPRSPITVADALVHVLPHGEEAREYSKEWLELELGKQQMAFLGRIGMGKTAIHESGMAGRFPALDRMEHKPEFFPVAKREPSLPEYMESIGTYPALPLLHGRNLAASVAFAHTPSGINIMRILEGLEIREAKRRLNIGENGHHPEKE